MEFGIDCLGGGGGQRVKIPPFTQFSLFVSFFLKFTFSLFDFNDFNDFFEFLIWGFV